ncbi:hypothetical protein Tco_1527309 [Tanacetum coccineum]
MLFLSSTISSRYPPTDNQLRTSSNPRTQATIQNGQVTVQDVQGSNLRVMRLILERVKLWEQGLSILLERQTSTRFFADRLEEIEDCDDLQLQTTSDFKADHVDAYDSDCDDEATAS